MSSPGLAAALYGLSTAVMWGVSDFLAAKASRSAGPIVAAFLVNAIAAVVYIVFFVVYLDTARKFTPSGVAFGALGGVLVMLGAILFFQGLNIGPVSLVSPLSSTYPLVTAALAIVVFGARLTWTQIVGILIVVVGVMGATEVVGGGSELRARPQRGPALALAAAIAWGLGYAFLAQAAERIGWQLTSLVQLTFTLLTIAALIPMLRRREKVVARETTKLLASGLIIGAGVIQLGGTVALNIGLTQGAGSGAVVTTISATYPLLTVILALRHFRERVRPIALIGALVAVSGVVILSSG